MGNLRFRFSDIMPNAWFYKLNYIPPADANPTISNSLPPPPTQTPTSSSRLALRCQIASRSRSSSGSDSRPSSLSRSRSPVRSLSLSLSFQVVVLFFTFSQSQLGSRSPRPQTKEEMTIHSVIIQKLLSTNAHLGKRAAAHHFKIFTSGVRDGVSIIDSDKTLICLRNATNFIAQLAREKNARFLFVNTNPLFDEIVEQMTKKIGLYSPRDKIIWKMGGFLTNSFSPKKFRSRNKKVCFAPVQPPDCVVVLDTERKSSVILEADRLQVPIVALVDSNLPREYYEKIAYPVPANDSMEFVYLFCNIITKTFMLERKKMREAKGDMVEDEPATSSKELGKEFQGSEQSKSITGTSSATDEVLVVPYQSLVPILEDFAETKHILDKLVVVKLNSALGTAIGFNGPKSIVEVCDGITSLDLVVNQIQTLNQKYGSDIPLVLINSARTHDDTSKVLGQYSRLNIDILPILQGQMLGEFPGIQENDKLYASDQEAALRSLIDSGALDVLLLKGKEYVLVVSSDNSAVAVDASDANNRISFDKSHGQ
ncbi:Ribosomal protein S2, mitochondrial [Linum perenne]